MRRLGTAIIVALLASLLVPIGTMSASAAPGDNPTPVFRFYKTDGSHFFTNNEAEKNQVQSTAASTYRYEGVAFYSYPTPTAGTSPVHRFYNFKQGVHFYTINQNEYETVLNTASATYRYEGVAYYATPGAVTDSTPVYRFYKFNQGVHFYTTNASEAAGLRANARSTYRDEGLAYQLPTKLTFSGAGDATSESFIMPTGLGVGTVTHSAEIQAELQQSGFPGEPLYLAFEGDPNPTSTWFPSDEGRYTLNVTTSAEWTVTLEFPRNSTGPLASISGTGDQASRLFSLSSGEHTFSYARDASASYFWAFLVDTTGNFAGEVSYFDAAEPESSDPQSGGTVFAPGTGPFLLQVYSDAPWAVSID